MTEPNPLGPRRRHTIFAYPIALIGTGLAVLILLSPVAYGSESIEDAKEFLSFEATTDGRCQNLSEGGKLTVMHNLHPKKNIRFRLFRFFVDVQQQGRATGIADPAGAPIKLGCNLVGGRLQRWVVERAEFTLEETQ